MFWWDELITADTNPGVPGWLRRSHKERSKGPWRCAGSAGATGEALGSDGTICGVFHGMGKLGGYLVPGEDVYGAGRGCLGFTCLGWLGAMEIVRWAGYVREGTGEAVNRCGEPGRREALSLLVVSSGWRSGSKEKSLTLKARHAPVRELAIVNQRQRARQPDLNEASLPER